MSHEIIMPVLGMNQNHGVIAKWHKKIGDLVKVGDILMDVETDKAITEIEAKHEGIVTQIIYEAGVEIPVGEVVATINHESAVRSDNDKSTHPVSIEEQTIHVAKKSKISKQSDKQVKQKRITKNPEPTNKVLGSPKAKHIARGYGLSLDELAIVNKKRPIKALDVEQYMQTNQHLTQYAEAHHKTPPSISLSVPKHEFHACINHLNLKHKKEEKNGGHLLAVLAYDLIQKQRLLVSNRITEELAIKVVCWEGQGIKTSFLNLQNTPRFSDLFINTTCDTPLLFEVICLSGSHIQRLSLTQSNTPIILLLERERDLQLDLIGFESSDLTNLLQFAESLAQSIEHPLIHLI